VRADSKKKGFEQKIRRLKKKLKEREGELARARVKLSEEDQEPWRQVRQKTLSIRLKNATKQRVFGWCEGWKTLLSSIDTSARTT
jgi:hypothetical protein